MAATAAEIRVLLAQIDEAYDHQSWHGSNLKGSLRGVTPRQAVWRPGPKRHNIWEIATHAAYWKYAAWRRLTAAKRGSFALDGSDWFPSPAPARAPRGVRASSSSTPSTSGCAWRFVISASRGCHDDLAAAN
tara:strand:+ start:4729 stop:5124 length:396 start_codon:yes stop_codon:yes gene_type:complete